MKNTLLVILSLLMSLGTMWAQDPYITVSPTRLNTVKAQVGQSVNFQTVHISQAHVTGPTYLYLSGYNSEMFSLSASEVPEGVHDVYLTITYTPTRTGTHTAILNVDNYNHTGLYQSVSLKGICEDTSLHPTLTVTPSELPAFEVAVGDEQIQTFTVTGSECKDYVYLRVDHIEGAGFSIDNTMMAKNTTGEVNVRFTPREAGSYQSTVTVYSQDAQSVVLTLNGTATPAGEDTRDWATDFKWIKQNPQAVLEESFDNVTHNKTLLLPEWQNVAPADERPWWGFRDGYAKATAFQYGKSETAQWYMWLVTPELDFPDAPYKKFSFKVMGEYLSSEDSVDTRLEVYLVTFDAQNNARFIDLTYMFNIPSLEEENNEWVLCILDMTSYESVIGDEFHIAFRYVGPNGMSGVITYYIDDVTWGIDQTPSGIQDAAQHSATLKLLRDGQVVIIRGNREYNILGRYLQHPN